VDDKHCHGGTVIVVSPSKNALGGTGSRKKIVEKPYRMPPSGELILKLYPVRDSNATDLKALC
jgi:hypothetical protein